MTPEGQISKDWDIMDHSETRDSPAQPQVPSPEINLTINAKKSTQEKTSECTCSVHPPKLSRKASNESIIEEAVEERYSRPRRRPPPFRRYSPSPIRIRSRSPNTISISSSTDLLSKANNHDGIAEFPMPARSSVYLTTFPFTDRDVRKWSWILGAGVEDTWMQEMDRRLPGCFYDDEEEDGFRGRAAFNAVEYSQRRNRSPYYEPFNGDIPAVFLSKVLDKEVMGEKEEGKEVKYLIVVQNRAKPPHTKLLVAESRKGTGVLIYYEALNNNSVVFVGVTLKGKRSWGKTPKFKRVESLDEVERVQEESGGTVVGVVC